MTCCGRQMTASGNGQWVCGKCGGWWQPGTVRLDPEYPCRCGGWHPAGQQCGGAA